VEETGRILDAPAGSIKNGIFIAMSANEELEEHAHHAKEPFDKKVAVTMAIIAALLATVSVGAHLYANEELLLQQKASDQWAYYQAKSSRRYASEVARDSLTSSAELSAKYAKNVEKYEKEGEEIQTEARKLEQESLLKGRQSLRMEIGQVFLEIGIVFASLAILTKRPLIWIVSVVSASVGVLIAITSEFPDWPGIVFRIHA
jgi:Flp pilus assembly protein TadB